MVYLDYNATTPLAPEAMEAMLPYLREHYGNPSSIHGAGRTTRAAIDDARDRIAHLLGTRPHEVIFTAGGTESDNLAILGLAHAHPGRHLVTAATEHHAVLRAFEHLERNEGFRVTYLPVDEDGRVDPRQLAAAITPDTALVSIMTANNETGVTQDMAAISAVCREHGVLLHADAVQSFGKEPLDTGLYDAVSLAAHKFHGPVGAGVLWLRSGVTIQSIQHGGSHENQRRPGTENVAAIAGMAAAAELALASMESDRPRIATLRDQLWEGVRSAAPEAVRNGRPEMQLANTLNVSFPGMDGEGLLINLDLEGICASSGSACMVGSIVPSHVLTAMGRTPEVAQATVRFSLGKWTTEEEIEETIGALPRIMSRLRDADAPADSR
ncbi:MAG: cysteine desulfurase family protein [Chthoniobacteraceae bacterium]|jgi:cysteine desulfurase